jgi:hypothetical protein
VAIGTTPDYTASLQMINGAFTSSTINTYAYANYANVLSNTRNYTNLPGEVQAAGTIYTSVYTPSPYKFARFAWVLPIASTITGFNFTIHNMKNINAVYNQNICQIFGLPNVNTNDPPVVVNFRLDDPAINGGRIDTTTISARTPANGYTTPWVNAMVVTGSQFGPSDMYTSQTNYTDEIQANGFGSTDIFTLDANNNLTITVFNAQQIPNTNVRTIYVHLLIGLPTRYDIRFSHVAASYF